MKSSKKPARRRRRALLLGLGLDNQDGHLRLTRGENYRLIGGSKDTHDLMQEKAVRFNEELTRRGKKLEQLSGDEFLDIADRIKMDEKT